MMMYNGKIEYSETDYDRDYNEMERAKFEYAEHLVKFFHAVAPDADVEIEILEDCWNDSEPVVVYTDDSGNRVCIKGLDDIHRIAGREVYTVRECMGTLECIEHYKRELIGVQSNKRTEWLEGRIDTLVKELNHMINHMITI